MIKMSRKAKKAMAVALTAGMLASTAATPVMAATKGWKQNTKGWWYENADGTYPANKWEKINGKWYYFDANGYMLSGWKKINANWYYLGAANDGAMKASAWQKDGSSWYYLTDNGAMFGGGWKKVNDKWYFFDNTGAMQSGVVTVDGKTYYLGSADDGAMKEGEQTINATKYNFAASEGHCTDATTPATNKHFDKDGAPVEVKVEIEKVAGINGVITNAIPEYQEEYGNVLFAGDLASYKVLVTDDKGNPVAGTPVSLKMKFKAGACSTDAASKFGVMNYDWVKETDSEGYVTFVIGADSDVTATSGQYALIELTASSVQMNKSTTTQLAFATISLGHIEELNDNPDSGLEVVKSTNASGTTDHSPYTYTIDGKAKTEYVTTQQVNEKNSTDHKVVFELKPEIKIPVIKSSQEIDDYQKDVNKEIKEYSVYQDGGETSFKVEKIPAGLKYATLKFSSVDVSDYTRVEIKTFEAGTGTQVGTTYIIDGPYTEKTKVFGYQIPVQLSQDKELDVEVKVISEGQVDENQNGGLVVTEVVGVYDTVKNDGTDSKPLVNCVEWSVVENEYSNEVTFDDVNDAIAYIPDSIDAKYKNPENIYTYQVPVYPYSGNGIMTVKDKNNKLLGYFTIPTINQNKYILDTDEYDNGSATNEDGFQNKNILVDANKQAILVSYDEAFNNEGTIKADGNKVEVNSEKTGVTAIQAKLNLSAYNIELDATNNKAFTSVHWSPIPTLEEKATGDDFYALVGQTITVKAQLVDNNGNKVSQAEKVISFAYGEQNTPILGLGAIGTGATATKATATNYSASTDANGQATLQITSGDELALVNLLHATCTGYNVQLTIGGETVTNANLRWVKPGLSFTSSVDTTDVDYEKAITLNSTAFGTNVTKDTSELTKVLAKDTGSEWIFGYEVIGETNDTGAVRYVESIEGLKVNVTKGGTGDITTTGMANGTAKITSTKAGATTLTGTIDEKSVVAGTDVVFKIKVGDKTETHTNVGEGTPTIGANLNLPITWGVVGTSINVIPPKGASMIVSGDETVYVKVVDAFGNPRVGEEVEVTVTYSDGVNTFAAGHNGAAVAADNVKKNTNSNGLVSLTIKPSVAGVAAPTTATISVKVGNETTQQTIQYKKAPTTVADFGMVDAKYEPKTTPNVVVTFSAPVNAETLNKDMFTILNDTTDKNVAIDSVAVDSNDNKKVVITLGAQHANGLNNDDDYIVTVTEKDVDGITYKLCDTYGREVTANDEVAFTTVADKLTAVYSVDDEKITFTVNGQTVNNAKIYGVYNSEYTGVIGDTTPVRFDTFNGTAITDVTKRAKEVTISFYCNGSSVDVTIPALTAAEKEAIAKQAAQDELDGAVAALAVPTVSLANGAVVTIATTTNCTVKAIEVTPINGQIFDTVDGTTLKLVADAESSISDTTPTATVKVTYQNGGTGATAVTKDVIYTVSVVNDGGLKIQFAK